jgi:hypothetical protein
MSHPDLRRRSPRRAALAALLAAALSACGTDAPSTVFDCCVGGVYYVCNTRVSYGQCISRPPDTTGCTLQVNPCPAAVPEEP